MGLTHSLKRKIETQTIVSLSSEEEPPSKQSVVILKYDLAITKQDMQTLEGTTWLNDKIIDFYMALIKGKFPKKAEL